MPHAYSAIPTSTSKEPTVLAPGIDAGSPLLNASRGLPLHDLDEDELDRAKHAGGSASVFSSVSK